MDAVPEAEEMDGLDDFLDMLEEGADENNDVDVSDVAPLSSTNPTSQTPLTPPRQTQKAPEDLTYEDLFGSPSPERKKAKKSEDAYSSSRSRTKVEATGNSAMVQLGSRPVLPSEISRVANIGGGLDTTQLIIDHHSRVRIFKTSIALYRDEGSSFEAVLMERNFGLQYVSLLNFPFWYKTKGVEVKNFWTSGVLVRKQPGVRKSAKGNDYALWEINDLKQLDKSWTIFLFSSATTAPSLSQICIGSLIDITTPSVLESSKGGPMKFSINNSNQIRVVGTAKDFGFCQSKRKDGKDCTAVVNTWECSTCIHHAASELKKLKGGSGNKRERKPAVSFARNLFDEPPRSNPKGEGICTVNFGKPPSGISKALTPSLAVTPKIPANMPSKSYSRMELQGSSVCSEVKRNSLSVGNASSISFKKETNEHFSKLPKLNSAPVKPAIDLDPLKTRHLTERDRAILSVLGSPSKSESGGNKKNQKNSAGEGKQCSAEIASRIASNPSSGSLNFMRYLTATETKGQDNVYETKKQEVQSVTMNRKTLQNMQKALDLVKKKGPIQKVDPNAVRKRKSLPMGLKVGENSKTNSSSASTSTSKKANCEVIFDFESDHFKQVLNAKSAHEEHTNDLAQSEYFDKLVKKEAIENKLLNTFSIATNAVMCKQCKYVALSQSEFCKGNQHQIRVVKATKRFFRCKDCGNRTMSLDRLPKHPCKTCNSPNWMPAPVGKEKTGPILPSEVLSIRGHEEKFVGSSSKVYLNLEVS